MKKPVTSKLIDDCLAWRCDTIALSTHLLYYIFRKPPSVLPGLGFQVSDFGEKAAKKTVGELLNFGGVLSEVSQYCQTTID